MTLDSPTRYGLQGHCASSTATRDRGVRLTRSPWSNSFAQARNVAIDAVATGLIVFLDADE